MMGYPDGWITKVPRVDNKQAVKLSGNGVVPQQAAAALHLLLDDLEV
jgi:DNA (cytosine-5)-methyltransferase 1